MKCNRGTSRESVIEELQIVACWEDFRALMMTRNRERNSFEASRNAIVGRYGKTHFL